MSTYQTVILDPGHGMSNRHPNVYDPGAVAGGVEEAAVALQIVNRLKKALEAKGKKVIRTRVGDKENVPVLSRARIAKKFNGDVMLSVHCNAANGRASGAECVYRGEENRAKAARISEVCATVLDIPDRGPKQEKDTQHKTLAVMSFQPTFLLETCFIDNAKDRLAVIDFDKQEKLAQELAKLF